MRPGGCSDWTTAIEADVCKPLPVHGPFDSAALNGVLHCLPGPLPRKAAAIGQRVAAVLAPTGVLFGATILGDSRHNTSLVAHRPQGEQPARAPSTTLVTPGKASAEILEESFEEVDLEAVGSMAIFAATNPRANQSTGRTP